MFESPYNDHPDGHDCLTKIKYCTVIGGKIGLFVSGYDVILYTKPKGYLPTILTVLRTTAPFALSAVTFATVACVSTNIRKKDDHVNYTIAGGTAGALFSLAFQMRKLSWKVFVIGMGAMIGFSIKNSMIYNWSLVGPTKSDFVEKSLNDTLYIKKSASS